MPKLFCTCGGVTEYTVTAATPKFCAHCGGPLGQTAQASAPVIAPVIQSQPNPAKPVLRAWRPDDDEDEDTGGPVDFVPPKKLAVTFTVDKPEKNTLGSVMQGTKDSIETDKPKKLTKKEAAAKLAKFREFLNTTQRHEIGGGRSDE